MRIGNPVAFSHLVPWRVVKGMVINMETIVKKVSYHLQVYDILKRRILDGDLKCGEKINENALSQSLGVSRSPVREALRMLEQDELVVVTPTGLMVNPLKSGNIIEVYECRMVLESYAASLGVAYLSDEVIDALEDCVRRALEYHRKKDYDKVVETNTHFHDVIISGCQNSHLLGMIEKNRSLSLLARNQEFSGFKRDESYLNEHMAIVEALKQRNNALVEERMRIHVMNDMKFYMEHWES